MFNGSGISNPFPGLRAFEEDEDVLFFGREKQVDELLTKLRNTRFLAVIGSSGSGKSSLVKSGLIPSLHSGFMSGAGSLWRICSFRPGNDPISNMAIGLAQPNVLYNLESEDDIQIYSAINESILRRSSTGLIGAYKQSGIDPKQNLLILVDQFEEIFRFSKYEKDAKDGKRDSVAFINLLLKATEQREIPIYVVFTMRSDFLGDCTEFRGLPEAINDGEYLVPRMTREERKDAIVAPISVAGASIEPRLLNQLLNDVGDNPDQLPILQHALMRTWDIWKQKNQPNQPLDIEHYEEIGTMQHALSQHAEEAYAELTTERQQHICEVLFKALTDKGSDSRGIRRPTKLGEICVMANAKMEEVVEVINVFRKGGRAFLMPPEKVTLTPSSIIDISHESLMRVWDRLSEWVYEEIESAELYLRLSKSAELYQEGRSGLWTNPDLALALKWRDNNHPNATWASRYDSFFERSIVFLEYSKKEFDAEVAKKERKQKNDLKRAKRFAIFLGSASILSLFFLVISLNLKFKAESSESKAKENEQKAIANSREATKQKQIALSQKEIAEQQRNIAEEQKLKTEQQTRIAIQEKKMADISRGVAVNEKQKAEVASVEADKQKKVAIAQGQIAESEKATAQREKTNAEREKENAERSERNTQRLRLLSIARSMAVQSVKNKNMNSDLPALLALQAYNFNAVNNGAENSPDIYYAVSGVADDKAILRGHRDAVRGISLSPDEKTLASCGDDGSVRVWNLAEKGQPVILNNGKLKNPEIRSVSFHHGGKYLVAGTVDGKILVWDVSVKNAAPKVVAAHSSIINKIQCSPVGDLFVTVSSDGFVKSWNINSADQPTASVNLGAKVTALSFSNNGDRVAVGTEKGNVTVYDARKMDQALVSINADSKPIRALAFNSSGDRIAAGTMAGDIMVYNSADRSKLTRVSVLHGHASAINAIVFNPDGKSIATCSYDKTVRIWTLKTPDEAPIVISDNNSWVMDIVFDKKGDRLISAGEDKMIRVFNTNVEELVGKICHIVKRNMTTEEWDAYVGKDIRYEKTCSTLQ